MGGVFGGGRRDDGEAQRRAEEARREADRRRREAEAESRRLTKEKEDLAKYRLSTKRRGRGGGAWYGWKIIYSYDDDEESDSD